MSTEGQSKMDKEVQAAFDIFWDDFRKKVAALNDPYMPQELKDAMKQTIQDVFRSGYSAAYASYILALYTRGDRPDSEG
jgi:hypothetical protein